MDLGILDILRADGSIVVNKRLIGKVGTLEAIVYSELASRFCYFRDRGKLTEEGYFYNTVQDLERATGVTRRYQDTAIKKLRDIGLLEMRVMGIPATRHFRFTARNRQNLLGLLAEDPGALAEEEARKQRIKWGRLFHAATKSISPHTVREITDAEAEEYGRQLEEAQRAEAEKNKFRYALCGADRNG